MAKKPSKPDSAEADALREGEFLPKDPATDVAQARTSPPKTGRNNQNIQLSSNQTPSKCALPRTGARLTIYRDGDMETIVVDNRTFYRDVAIGRLVGLARPRDIRRRFASMIEDGKIAEHQYIILEDDDAGKVYYVDRETAIRAAFRSNTGNAETVVMQMVGAVSNQAINSAAISLKDALAGYDRTISFMAGKAPRMAKIAKLPLLEMYARSAGLPIPDVSELIGPDQPRLDGV